MDGGSLKGMFFYLWICGPLNTHFSSFSKRGEGDYENGEIEKTNYAICTLIQTENRRNAVY
jgi:hypothetical protein